MKTSKPSPKRRAAGPLDRLVDDPAHRQLADQLRRVRECLRLSPAEFAQTMKITPARLAEYEANRAPWPGDVIAAALERLSELCSTAQNAVESAVETLMEIEVIEGMAR